ncbi:hypothetical protein CLAIMM_00748 [Cladophialophora immunda]|nr:hypothetical protein CLAIMM_00748 [Cladophialophora immunda]
MKAYGAPLVQAPAKRQTVSPLFLSTFSMERNNPRTSTQAVITYLLPAGAQEYFSETPVYYSLLLANCLPSSQGICIRQEVLKPGSAPQHDQPIYPRVHRRSSP